MDRSTATARAASEATGRMQAACSCWLIEAGGRGAGQRANARPTQPAPSAAKREETDRGGTTNHNDSGQSTAAEWQQTKLLGSKIQTDKRSKLHHCLLTWIEEMKQNKRMQTSCAMFAINNAWSVAA